MTGYIPYVVMRKSEGVSVARANGITVHDYFKLLKNVMEENDLIGKPGHVHNMDEPYGLQLNNKPSSVLAIKGQQRSPHLHRVRKGNPSPCWHV